MLHAAARGFRYTHRTHRKCRSIASAVSPFLTEPHGHLPSSQSPITSELKFFNSVTPEGTQIPTYRVLDGVGKPIEGADVPDVCITMIIICFRQQLNYTD